MTWHLGELAPFDTESTGTNVEVARIVTATVAHIQPGAEPVIASHLIAVDVDIPQQATDVHGITTEHARANGKPAVEVLETVASHLADLMSAGVPVVGMNLAYDFSLLDRELRRNSLPTLDARLGREIGPCLDIFVIDKAIDRYRKGGRKLTDMCAHYGVRLDGAHDATADALGAARVAYRIGQRAHMDSDQLRDLYADRPRQAGHIVRAFTAIGGMTLAELHEAQKGWYREQALSLAQYFRQKANEEEHQASRAAEEGVREQGLRDAEELRRRADEVSTEWPLRPRTGGAL